MMKNDQWKDWLSEKLANHESVVDDSDWDIISRRLQGGRKRTTVITWFTASGAAAVVLVAISLFVQQRTPVETFISTNSSPAIVQQESPHTGATTLAVAEENKQAPREAATKPVLATAKDPVRKGRDQQPAITEKNHRVEERVAIVSTHKELLAEALPADTPAETPVDETESKMEKENATDIFPLFLEEQDKPGKKARKWAIAFAASQTSAISFPADYATPPALMDVMYTMQPSSYTLTAENKANPITINHHTPLSFGLTLRYYFTKRWAVESGLVYTYLSSDYEDQLHNGTKQQLHYLGIPLNAVYQFIQWKRWAAYVSGGGMMEKGLSADYSPLGASTDPSRNEKIAGLQWSLNGQAGVSYNITKYLGLYVEPGLRYFFKSEEQPESIRTDHPLNFNMGFGLRTNF